MMRTTLLLALLAGCRFDMPPRCGDGVVDEGLGEVCDDGKNYDGDGCSADCRSDERCGNGILDYREACDDRNVIDGDGCDSNCTFTRCGNGVLTQDEECDDGNSNNFDSCVLDCANAMCGDGHLWSGAEECDAGPDNSNYGTCLENCRFAVCGDGYVRTGNEVCDDGNNISCGTCNATCTATRAGSDCPSGVGCIVDADCASAICLIVSRRCQ